MISYHQTRVKYIKVYNRRKFHSIGGKKGSLISRIVLMCDELSTLD